MQSNITQIKIKDAVRSLFLVLTLFCLVTGKVNAQQYSNGPLSTGATSSNGTAAPAGTTWSELQTPNTSAGFGANVTAGFTVADNFTVTGTWAITTATFYAYSTGYTGTTSPFTDVRVQIYNTDPSVGNPTPIYGNLTANRFASSTFANMYRIARGTSGLTRKIWAINANINTTLTAGTYWIEWQVGTTLASNFTPAVTVLGAATQPGWNAKQRTLPSTWTAITDAGGPQDMPFVINYTTSTCTGTPAAGNTITSSPSVCSGSPFTLTPQNPTSGVGVTYQWQSGPSASGPFTNIAGANSSSYTSTLSASTFFQVIVSCGTNADTTNPVQVTFNPFTQCYCIPAPASSCAFNDVITNVTIGALNNTSGCSTGGYTNYTTTVDTVNIIAGAANPMRVTVGPGGAEYVGVWIDYDKDGLFEATEFTALGIGNGVTIAGNINIPANAPLGVTGMRVRVRYDTPLTGADACLGYQFGETEDYLVNIVPCVQGVITTQPANRTVQCSGTTSFTIGATGSLLTYRYEYRVSPTSPWLFVPNSGVFSGANTNTLTITNPTAAENGYTFRVVVEGGCTATIISDTARLTVTALPASVNPSAATICLGASQAIRILNPGGFGTPVTQTFTGATNVAIPDGVFTGVLTPVTVSGIPLGAVITEVKATLNITHSFVGDLEINLLAPNGGNLNLIGQLNGGQGTNSTDDFVNTVISSLGTTPLSGAPAPRTGTFRADALNGYGPQGNTQNVTSFAGLTSVPNGTWRLGLSDWYTLDAGTLNSWTLSITYTPIVGLPAVFTTDSTSLNTMFTDSLGTIPYVAGTPVNIIWVKPTRVGVNNYTVAINNTTCPIAPIVVPITVSSPIVGTSTITSSAACQNGNTTLTASAPTSGSVLQHQWKVSTDNGATFTNVTNTGVYSGATTSTLTITGAQTSMNGYRYRDSIYVTACNSSILTNTVTLTVNPIPTVVVNANQTTLIPGQTSTLSVTSNPAGASYQWYLNGVLIPGATASTLVADVDGFGNYTVEVTDINGCKKTSNAISITGGTSENVFIYPSPNTGQFQVRYSNPNGPNSGLSRMLNIYDSKGVRVYSREYAITNPFERMDVDLRQHGKGVYIVELADRFGARLKVGRVVIF